MTPATDNASISPSSGEVAVADPGTDHAVGAVRGWDRMSRGKAEHRRHTACDGRGWDRFGRRVARELSLPIGAPLHSPPPKHHATNHGQHGSLGNAFCVASEIDPELCTRPMSAFGRRSGVGKA